MEETQQLWVEKYRPKEFSDVVGQEHIVKRVKMMVEQKNLPHMLFAGFPGTGKTTLALIVAKALFGETWRNNLLELNASVAPETPILVRKDGKIKRTNFAALGQEFLKNGKDKVNVTNLEILSTDKNDYTVKFMPVSTIMRHRTSKIAKIKYEGGEIRTSLNHSVIIVNEKGDLIAKRVEKLKNNETLITFKTVLNEEQNVLDISVYKPQETFAKTGIMNPKLRAIYDAISLNTDLSWLFGLYLAEGCTSINKKNSSGNVIFTVGYPQEMDVVNRVISIADQHLSLQCATKLGASGFDRDIKSSMQVNFCNTQLTRFIRDEFYEGNIKRATTKRTPSFIYSADVANRIAFLKGYMGDAYGEWEQYVRYSSRSKENLIDIAWLGRLCGLGTSSFDEESRLIWDKSAYSTESMSVPPALTLLTLADAKNPRYVLRHQLYGKKSARVSKRTVSNIIGKIQTKETNNPTLNKLLEFLDSDLSAVKIKKIEIEEYSGYVYDVSVPGSEMFWGGTMPVLLHNSDDRGIDVVRNQVKDFARTKAMGTNLPKIIYLDEADALTKEAQQALRRTMESFSQTARFILSANFSSNIIEPIQSRCAVFRFKPLENKDVAEVVKKVAKEEELQIDAKTIDAVAEAAEGDLRKALNILQSCASYDKKITEKHLYEIASAASPKEVKAVLELALKKDFLKAREKLLEVMVNQGLSGTDIIKQIQKEIWNLDISDDMKLKLTEKCGEAEFRIVEGSDEFIQLEALLAGFVVAK